MQNRKLKNIYRCALLFKQKFLMALLGRMWLNVIENKNSIPSTLYIECTNRCNAKCVFCLYPKIEKKISTKILSVDDFYNIISQYSDMGGKSVALTPTLADPLTDPYFANRIQILEEIGILDVSFYTNLISFGHHIENALLDAKKIKLNICVSITGFTKVDYVNFMGVDRFEKVKNNIRKLSSVCKKNKNIKATIVLRDYIDSEISKVDMIKFLNSLELNYIVQDEFDTWGGELEEELSKNSRIRIKKRFDRVGPCSISFKKPLITVDGDLKICDCRDAHGELVVGNVFETKLVELWTGTKIKFLRDLFYTPDSLPKVCQRCEHYKSIY